MINFLGQFFHAVVYQPLFNGLILLYNFLPGHDLGLAVILLTLFIKVLTFPVNWKAYSFQRAMAGVQSRLKEIQVKYKSQPEEQARRVSDLFRQEKINPLASFLPLLVQLPVLIALYQLFWKGIWQNTSGLLYPFVGSPGNINPSFLNLIDLARPFWVLALLAAVAQFFQARLVSPPATPAADQSQMAALMQKQMLLLFPVLTFFILLNLPSVLGLYWGASSAFSVIEQALFKKYALPGKQRNN